MFFSSVIAKFAQLVTKL